MPAAARLGQDPRSVALHSSFVCGQRVPEDLSPGTHGEEAGRKAEVLGLKQALLPETSVF